jgi:hypothetical protein
VVRGGSGNDTYLASHGLDSISGYNGGTDTIVVRVEFDASDIKIYRIKCKRPTDGILKLRGGFVEEGK